MCYHTCIVLLYIPCDLSSLQFEWPWGENLYNLDFCLIIPQINLTFIYNIGPSDTIGVKLQELSNL